MKNQPTHLELVLQWHGQFRRSLEPLRVTPLQAGVLLFIHRHETAKLKDVATGLGVKSPTLGEVVKDLVQKRWVTNRRAHHDDRVLCLRLSHTGVELIRRIMGHLPNLKKDFASSKGQ
jgi:DNA-binding MarR family transcriptional regulator